VHRSIYHSTLTAITVGEAERVAGEVQRAVAVGATLVTDGGRSGPFMSPTVLTDVPRNDPIWTDEIFVTWSGTQALTTVAAANSAM
jgi:acyl-CoA reductase-like NAD-dependent aldehyde dehydrogenase